MPRGVLLSITHPEREKVPLVGNVAERQRTLELDLVLAGQMTCRFLERLERDRSGTTEIVADPDPGEETMIVSEVIDDTTRMGGEDRLDEILSVFEEQEDLGAEGDIVSQIGTTDPLMKYVRDRVNEQEESGAEVIFGTDPSLSHAIEEELATRERGGYRDMVFDTQGVERDILGRAANPQDINPDEREIGWALVRRYQSGISASGTGDGNADVRHVIVSTGTIGQEGGYPTGLLLAITNVGGYLGSTNLLRGVFFLS